MRSRLGLVLFITVVVFSVVGVATHVMAADPAPAAAATDTGTGTGTSSSGPLPLPNPPMNLETEGAMPSTFRGGDPDSGLIHVLEDFPYKRQEHSILYEEDASALGDQGATFDGPPTINWTTTPVDENGEPTGPVVNANTNQATNVSEFPDPGYYQVGNGGARQVSGGSSDGAGTGGDGTGQGAGGDGTGNGAGGDGTGNGAGGNGDGTGAGGDGTGNGAGGNGDGTGAGGDGTGQRVTANQTMGVQCHDCTTPNLWAVIQEGGGTTEVARDEEALKNAVALQMAEKCLIKGGKALKKEEVKLSGDLAEASLLALYEDPPNAKPKEKTSQIILDGPIFDKDGKKLRNEEVAIQQTLLNEAEQTRTAIVNDAAVKGVFVRRNVPFLMAAHMTDNGKFNSKAANCYIVVKGQENSIQKTDNSYLFRQPNFPRAEYADQPEYEFIVQGLDAEGNRTEVRVPLFVVDTQASFEAGQSR